MNIPVQGISQNHVSMVSFSWIYLDSTNKWFGMIIWLFVSWEQTIKYNEP